MQCPECDTKLQEIGLFLECQKCSRSYMNSKELEDQLEESSDMFDMDDSPETTELGKIVYNLQD